MEEEKINEQLLPQTAQLLVLEKEGLVYENGEYQVKKIREEINLGLFDRVVQVLGYSGFDKQQIQQYIMDFGQYIINKHFVFLERDIPEMSDYSDTKRRKNFFTNTCTRKLRMQAPQHYRELPKSQYLNLLKLIASENEAIMISNQTHGKMKFYAFTSLGFEKLQSRDDYARQEFHQVSTLIIAEIFHLQRKALQEQALQMSERIRQLEADIQYGFIYCIFGMIESKMRVYVGQTDQDPVQLRVQGHKSDEVGVLLKHFPEQMHSITLEKCVAQKLDERENYWLSKVKLFAARKLPLGIIDTTHETVILNANNTPNFQYFQEENEKKIIGEIIAQYGQRLEDDYQEKTAQKSENEKLRQRNEQLEKQNAIIDELCEHLLVDKELSFEEKKVELLARVDDQRASSFIGTNKKKINRMFGMKLRDRPENYKNYYKKIVTNWQQ